MDEPRSVENLENENESKEEISDIGNEDENKWSIYPKDEKLY